MHDRPDVVELINRMLSSEAYQRYRNLPDITDEEESLCREKARAIHNFMRESRHAEKQGNSELVQRFALLLMEELEKPFVLSDGSTKPVDLRLVPWIFDLQQQQAFFEDTPDELLRAKEETAAYFRDGRRFSFQRWLEFIAAGRIAQRFRAEGRLN